MQNPPGYVTTEADKEVHVIFISLELWATFLLRSNVTPVVGVSYHFMNIYQMYAGLSSAFDVYGCYTLIANLSICNVVLWKPHRSKAWPVTVSHIACKRKLSTQTSQ